MSINLTHTNIRGLAKALRRATGDTVRHSEIIADIAASLGLKPDAMMHFLKSADKSIDISDRFVSTLSRRLSARPVEDVRLVSPWGVLRVLATALQRSPTEVGNDLGGQHRAGPGKVIVYDEFQLISKPDPAETFRTMFPVFYATEDTLKPFGVPVTTKKLTCISNGWYKGER